MNFYLPELDGLRFVAFFIVFLHHSFPFDFLTAFSNFGWIGVDLFFVLSSFLITELLLREREKYGKVSLKSFWIRRTLRIWPVYFLYLLLEYAVFTPLGWANAYETHEYLISKLFFFQNIKRSLNPDWPNVGSHLWTIAMEEQFYLLWPATIAFVSRNLYPAIVTGMVAVSLIARALFVEVPGKTFWFIYSNPIARLDAFAFGILLCLVYRNEEFRDAVRKYSLSIGLLGCAFLFLVWRQMPESQTTEPVVIGAYFLVDLGLALIVLGVLLNQRLQKLFSARPMVWLGKRSYTMYLFHLPMLEATRPWWTTMGAAARAGCALAITIAISGVSYRYFERYFLLVKEKFARVPSRPI